MCLMSAIIFFALGLTFGPSWRLAKILAPYIVAVIVFMLALSPTTAASISMEGSSLWLIRSSPISTKKWFWSKILVHLTFFMPTGVISAVLFSIGFNLPVGVVLLSVPMAVSIVLFSAFLGLFSNILFPRLDWVSESQVVKQSMAVFIPMIAAMFLTAGIIVFATFVNLSVDINFIIFTAFFTAADVALYLLIIKRGEDLLARKI